jgi:hypothetical protein
VLVVFEGCAVFVHLTNELCCLPSEIPRLKYTMAQVVLLVGEDVLLHFAVRLLRGKFVFAWSID